MKTLKEFEKKLDIINNLEQFSLFVWYKKAIEWMLEDIQNSQVTSVKTIEKWLENLLSN